MSNDDRNPTNGMVARLCQPRVVSGFAERSGGDASDTDGKSEGRASRARASQTPYNHSALVILSSFWNSSFACHAIASAWAGDFPDFPAGKFMWLPIDTNPR